MARSREASSESLSRRERSLSRSRSPSPRRRSPSGRRPDRSPRRRSRSPLKQKYENPEPCKCLGVFGLSLRTDEKELKDIFRKIGSIESVTVVYDRRTGRSRGFGFIRYKHQSDADEARNSMNGIDIDGRRIRVDYSVTKRPHSPTPGIYMGKVDNRDRDYRSPINGRDRERDYRSPSYGSRYDDRRDYDRKSSYRRRSRSPTYHRR